MGPMGFPGGSDGKKTACNSRDLGLIPELERSPGERNGSPLQYSCLGNPKDREAWRATVHVGYSHRVRQDWATRHSCTHGYHMFLAYNPLKARASSSLWPGFKGYFCSFSITSFSVLRPCWVFPDGSGGKEPPCSAGNIIPGSGRAFGEGNGNPLQYSWLGNPMDRGAWWTTVCGISKSWTRLSKHTHRACWYHLFCIVLLKVK